MRNVRRAGPLAGAALVVALTSGCSQAPIGPACDANLQASAEALQGAMTDLVTVSGQMRASLAVACAAAGMSTILIEGGECQVGAQTQFTCEEQCDVMHQCMPGPVRRELQGHLHRRLHARRQRLDQLRRPGHLPGRLLGRLHAARMRGHAQPPELHPRHQLRGRVRGPGLARSDLLAPASGPGDGG